MKHDDKYLSLERTEEIKNQFDASILNFLMMGANSPRRI